MNISNALMVFCVCGALVSCKKKTTIHSEKTNNVDVKQANCLAASESFKVKITKLHGGGESDAIDLDEIARLISNGYFTVDEVLYWLDERALSKQEIEQIKNGDMIMESDRNACFWFLGKEAPKIALGYYYQNLMGVSMIEGDGSLKEIDLSWIPQAQKKWADQYLENIVNGWMQSSPEESNAWISIMKEKHGLIIR